MRFNVWVAALSAVLVLAPAPQWGTRPRASMRLAVAQLTGEQVGHLAYWGSSIGEYFVPQELMADNSTRDFDIGFRYALAQKMDGSLVAWGNDDNGEVSLLPDFLKQPNNIIKQFVAGKFHGLALLTNGTLIQWTNRTTLPPVPAGAVQGAEKIWGGDESSFALFPDGRLFGWGEGVTGTSGEPAADNLPPLMTGFTGLKNVVVTLKNGWLALFENGTLVNNTVAEGTPWAGASGAHIEDVQDIAVSERNAPIHFLVLFKNGTIKAWGRNDDGQSSAPTERVTNGVQVSAGITTSVLLANGTIVGWGADHFGQVSFTTGLPPVAKVMDGEGWTLALLKSGALRTWGRMRFKSFPPGFNDSSVLDVAAGTQHIVVRTGDQRVMTWGADFNTGVTKLPASLQSAQVTAIAAGLNHTLAITGGRVVSWGLLPDEGVPAAARANVTAIGAGFGFSIAVLADGSPLVWGNETTLARCNLTAAPAGKRLTAVVAGAEHIVGLVDDGTVVAWGCNTLKQTAVPASIAAPGGAPVVSIAAGAWHNLAMRSDGTVAKWGDPSQDKLNAQLDSMTDVTAIACGPNTTIVHRASLGQVWVFGIPVDAVSKNQQGFATLQLDPGQNITKLAASKYAVMGVSQTTPTLDASAGDSGLSTGAIVGIAVGASVGGLLLLAGVGALFWKRRRDHQRDMYSKDSGSLAAVLTVGDDSANWKPKSVGQLPAKLPGLTTGEVFTRATAFEYAWVDDKADEQRVLAEGVAVEAGINDSQLDKLLGGAHADAPVVQLTKADLRDQIQLLPGGLLGRGATALCFKCIWPNRFGNGILAAKVLKDGYESDVSVLQSFQYEANVLSAAIHPNIVRLYGYCLEPPTVCLILELLPLSLKDKLYRGGKPSVLTGSNAALVGTGTGTGNTQTLFVTVTAEGADDTVGQYHTALTGGPGHLGNTTNGAGNNGTDHSNGPGIGSPGPHTMLSNALSATLDTAYEKKPADHRPISMTEVLQICTDVAAGLAYLHTRSVGTLPAPSTDPVTEHDSQLSWKSSVTQSSVGGASDAPSHGSKLTRIVHRDLKPANILLNSRGSAKISDFGLARQHHATTVMTMAQGAGTLPYMAPELLASRTGGLHDHITNRCDVYALGMMMWEMLAGKMPWSGMSEASILAAVVGRRRPELPHTEEHAGMDSVDEAGDGFAPSETDNGDDSVADSPGPASMMRSMRSARHRDLSNLPASLDALPELNMIIKACWQQRDLRRPTAQAVHARLRSLMSHYGRGYGSMDAGSMTSGDWAMPAPSVGGLTTLEEDEHAGTA